MLHLLWTRCHAERNADCPLAPCTDSLPAWATIRASRPACSQGPALGNGRDIRILELIFDQAARAYEDAVRKRALWKLEHPNFQPPEEGQANLNASEEDFKRLDEGVSHTENVVLLAVDSLRPYWDQTKENIITAL